MDGLSLGSLEGKAQKKVSKYKFYIYKFEEKKNVERNIYLGNYFKIK